MLALGLPGGLPTGDEILQPFADLRVRDRYQGAFVELVCLVRWEELDGARAIAADCRE